MEKESQWTNRKNNELFKISLQSTSHYIPFIPNSMTSSQQGVTTEMYIYTNYHKYTLSVGCLSANHSTSFKLTTFISFMMIGRLNVSRDNKQTVEGEPLCEGRVCKIIFRDTAYK